MKIKISITHWITGNILFEYESEGNTKKKTLEEAVKREADLRGADLRGADLREADLRGAYLQGACLQGADLREADLREACLQGEKIKTAAVFTGLYTYVVVPYITETGVKRIKMGCHNRTLKEWEDNFWNNNREFPNDNSLKSNLRLMALNTAKAWFELVEKENI